MVSGSPVGKSKLWEWSNSTINCVLGKASIIHPLKMGSFDFMIFNYYTLVKTFYTVLPALYYL